MEKRKAKKAGVDSRPLHDANFVKEQTRGLFRYLVTHGYPFPVSVAQLITPSRTEVWTVACFLLRSINSEKAVRTWSELVTVARDVGYPFTITQGTPSTNLQTLLGFLFWLCELLTAMELRRSEEEIGSSDELATQYLLNSYGWYMAGDADEQLAEERKGLFSAASTARETLLDEKKSLQIQLSRLESNKRSSPSQPKYEVEKLEAENQLFLVKVIAPLDEQRRQLREALAQMGEGGGEDLESLESEIERLETECERLAEDKAELTDELGDEAEDIDIERIMQHMQDELQELEHADLSLRSEIDLAIEHKEYLEQAQRFSEARITPLKRTYAAAKAKTHSLLAAQKALQDDTQKEIRMAGDMLRQDAAYLSLQLQTLSKTESSS